MKSIRSLKHYIEGQISKGSARSVKAKKNIVGIVLMKGLSFGIQFLLVPLTLNYLSPTEYGIWLTLSSIVAWFALFDLGLGNGLRNRFAENTATKNFEKARIFLSTTYAWLLFIIVILTVLFGISSVFVSWTTVLNAPHRMDRELLQLALVVFCFFCIQFVFKTISTVVTADQKPAIAELFTMVAQLLSLMSVFILTRVTSGSLLYLGIAMSATPAIVFVVGSGFFYTEKYKHLAPSLKYVDFSYTKSLYSIGLKFLIIQIAYMAIFQTNNIIIAHVCSPKDVTIFNIAYKYMSISYIAFTIFIAPLWSAFTEAFAVKDYAWMKGIFKKLNIFALMPILLSLFLVIVSGFAYQLWIGDTVVIPKATSAMMAVYMILSVWVYLYTSILNGVGKVYIQLLTYILSMVLHIPLAIFLGKAYGTNGVIFSASVFMCLITFISFIQVKKVIYQTNTGWWDK